MSKIAELCAGNGIPEPIWEVETMNKKLGRYLEPASWVFFAVLGAFVVAAAAFQNFILAGCEAALTILLLALYLRQRKQRKAVLQNYLQSALAIPEAGTPALSPFPTVMVRLADGVITYANEDFASAADLHDGFTDRTITELVPELKLDWLTEGKHEFPFDVTVKGRRYRVYGIQNRANDAAGTMLAILFFSDLTELYLVRDEYIRSRPVMSIILIDNYEELTKNLTEGAISTLNAQIDSTITGWTEQYNGLLRRLERSRYLFLFERRDLNRAIQDKFSLLEQIHQITSPAGLAASISLGLGVDGATFDECYRFASLAIEMSLSRGGDQAVIKDRYKFSFYGGRTREADHRSKVRSRVTANSIMELIGQSSQVFIMGHKNADLDAVGAAMGIGCLCRKKGQKFKIVLDLDNNAAEKLIAEIRQVPEYKDAFISGQEALLLCDSHSILVVVDTNRPDQVESQSLLEAISKVCVVDHHRRAADYIEPVVQLHEPYASSASELTTELLQYAVDKSDVLPIEAKSLLAGIFLDTKSFNVRTGERTFEAAAYLRQLGADPVEVKVLLQNDFQDTMAKYQIIRSARLYRQEIAIAALNAATSRVLAAQAADELLNISGLSASFVLYPDGDTVIISARSIGKANVQVILEPLGGGGNAATAGAQMKHTTVKDALDQLMASIDRFYEK